MRPIFTIHAGEFLVGQYIESNFKNKRVYVPTKDTGVDLLVTNSAATKAVTLQVKFSRDFLPVMKDPPATRRSLRSCTWFSFERQKIVESSAGFWVLVLLGFEARTYDYLVISPQELKSKLEKLHGNSKRYQVYVWVTKRRRVWLTRGLAATDKEAIARDAFTENAREVTRYLNDWSAVKNL